MFSSNPFKFFVLSALIFLLFSGCRFASKTTDANSPATPAVSDELKSEVPFSTKEPEQFQAEMVVTAGETERKTFIARNGTNHRWDFNFGAKNQLTNLQTDKDYLLFPDRKIYTEKSAGYPAAANNDWREFLTTRWLSEKTEAKFEKLESVENLTKYRVRMDENPASEIFVYVDETNGLPVKQEFYSIAGEPKLLTYAFELKNLKLQTDAEIFAVPADFRLVSTEEFWKIWRGEAQK